LKDASIPSEVKVAMIYTKQQEHQQEQAMKQQEHQQEQAMKQQVQQEQFKMKMILIYVLIISASAVYVGRCLRDGLLGSPAQRVAESVNSISLKLGYAAAASIISGLVTTCKRCMQLLGVKFR
jgi:hypothetical protein